jgi:predicted HTH transcriptional regulator
MKEFWRDYLKLHTRYPIIDLGWKGEKINNSFKIDKREIIRTKGNKEIILAILQNEQLSVNQLADRLNMTRQGIRYHIHNLLNQRKIRIADKNQLNWLYGV